MDSKIQCRRAVAPSAAAATATAQLAAVSLSIDENFISLPDELIEVEILARLDVKTLHKFKSVSKPYESIISHLKFGLHYTQKAYSSPESLSSSGMRSTMLFSKNVKDLASAGNQEDTLPISVNSISLSDIMSHLIIASTNGLVLSKYYDYLQNRMSFSLWVSNPMTKQCVMLPYNGLLTWLAMEYGFASRRDQATDTYNLQCKDKIQQKTLY